MLFFPPLTSGYIVLNDFYAAASKNPKRKMPVSVSARLDINRNKTICISSTNLDCLRTNLQLLLLQEHQLLFTNELFMIFSLHAFYSITTALARANQRAQQKRRKTHTHQIKAIN